MADSLLRHIDILHHLEHNNFKEQLLKEEKDDSFCTLIIYYLESRGNKQLPRLQVPIQEFTIENGVLSHNGKHEPSCEVSQLVIHKSLVK